MNSKEGLERISEIRNAIIILEDKKKFHENDIDDSGLYDSCIEQINNLIQEAKEIYEKFKDDQIGCGTGVRYEDLNFNIGYFECGFGSLKETSPSAEEVKTSLKRAIKKVNSLKETQEN